MLSILEMWKLRLRKVQSLSPDRSPKLVSGGICFRTRTKLNQKSLLGFSIPCTKYLKHLMIKSIFLFYLFDNWRFSGRHSKNNNNNNKTLVLSEELTRMSLSRNRTRKIVNPFSFSLCGYHLPSGKLEKCL